MTAIIVSLIWAALGGLFLWRLDRFASRWLEWRGQQQETPKPMLIPDDLMALVLSEDGGSPEATKHAQRFVEDAIRESFDQHKDWNRVRTAMGLGLRD